MKRDTKILKKILQNIECVDENQETIILNHKVYLEKNGYIKALIHYNTESALRYVDMIDIQEITEKGYNYLEELINSKSIDNSPHNIIYVEGDINAPIIIGDDNDIEFKQNFNKLIQIINNSKLENKDKIIDDLNRNKYDKDKLKENLLSLLTRSAEIITIAPIIALLLG